MNTRRRSALLRDLDYASQNVADVIRQRIVRGSLKEGENLPSESHLIGQFGVSRPTLREAIRVLEAERLIEIIQGTRSGAKVLGPRVACVSRYAGFVLQSQAVTLTDIYDARLAIEPYLVRLLADAPSSNALKQLRSEAETMRRFVQGGRYAKFMHCLSCFHHVLVTSVGQRTLSLLGDVLQDVCAQHHARLLRFCQSRETELCAHSLRGLNSVQRLIKLIETRDAEAAERHWRLHLVNARTAWLVYRENDEIVELL